MFAAHELRTRTFVRHVEIHDTIGSTNDRTLELARDAQIELPALVVARVQTAGRGRGQHTWWAAEGALTFSLLLDQASTGIAPANWPQLSLTTAVAVCDALAVELKSSDNPARPFIKWPNDVLLAGRKICGILIESPGGNAPAKNRLIVGVGINVNNSWQNAPREVETTGTALCDATSYPHELQPVLIAVLSTFAHRLQQLRHNDADLIAAWNKLNCFADKTVVIEHNGRMLVGKCDQLAADGAFILRDELAGRQRHVSGTVRLA